MAISRSTGLVDFVASKGSVRQAMTNCRVHLFGGTMPGSADTGSGANTRAVTLTLASGAFQMETLPKWRFTMTGSSGSVDSIKIGGVEQLPAAVPYTTSLANTASLIVSAINNNGALPDYTAAVTGAGSDEVAIYGPVSCGSTLNNLVLDVTATTLVATEASAGAVETLGDDAENSCNWQYVPAAGVLSKESTVWSGVIENTVSPVTWFMIATDNDNGTGSSTTARRIIGSVGTSGADLNLSSTSLTAGASVTVNAWTLSVTR